MSPTQYENAIAAIYRSKGFETETTQLSNDFGVDVFAVRGEEKIVIQAKMYGQTRPVIREMIFMLQGTKDYFGATRAVMATDGKLTPSAIEVAGALGIEVLKISPEELLSFIPDNVPQNALAAFDRIWDKFILPLKGKTLTGPTGLQNKILDVNAGGIERITENGNSNKLPVEAFRRAINEIVRNGFVTRKMINEEFVKRGSSGVVLVLSQLPFLEYWEVPTPRFKLLPEVFGKSLVL